MATRGRKPLPTALKELEGDRGKGRRPLNKDEPTPPQDNVKCPAWLMPEAKKEWKRLAPSLIAMGVLTEHDMEAFAGYCQAYARWREAEEFLSQHGTIFKTPSGYVQQVPQVSIAMQNLKIMQSFCTEFGLTPASRARLYANSGDSAASDDPSRIWSGTRKNTQMPPLRSPSWRVRSRPCRRPCRTARMLSARPPLI